MTIAISKFDGMAPRVAPRQLNPNMAQSAINCKLWSTLIPFKESKFIATPTRAGIKKSIHLIGQSPASTSVGSHNIIGAPMNGMALNSEGAGFSVPVFDTSLDASSGIWLHWAVDVNVARGFVQNDTSDRVYYTGDGVPKVTDVTMAVDGGTDYPMKFYNLGVPFPTVAPTLAAIAGSGTADTRAYVTTFVTGWGEESSPSDASAPITVSAVQSVVVTRAATPPVGDYNITHWRIYRVNTGSSGAEYQFVAEVAIGTATYTDSVLAANLGEVLPTLGWLPPPSNLSGLINLPNGGMAGFFSNTLCFCEPWKPYAWPIKYQLTTDTDIVAIAACSAGVIVTTTRGVYLCAGSDPASMSLIKLDAPQSCISKRSMVGFGGGVAYASPDGIMATNGGEPVNMTDGYFTRDEWMALNPASMTACIQDGRYFCFYDNGTKAGFVIDPTSSMAGLVMLDTHATAVFSDPLTDGLYLVIDGDIVRWDGGDTNKTLKWKSKVFTHAKPQTMSFGQVFAAQYPIKLMVYADTRLKHIQQVNNDKPFSLPSGFKARDWEVEVESTFEVYGAIVAESMEVLRNA